MEVSWQKMDSAPSGRLVLLSVDGEIGVGRHYNGKYWEFVGLESSGTFEEPDMWCDIIEAPHVRDL